MGYSLQRDENNQDRTFHGSNAYPFVCYPLCPSQFVDQRIPWHWHTDLQFCVVTEGVVEFDVNSDVLTLGPGEGVFINSRHLHQIQNCSGDDGRYLCLDFHPKMLVGYLGSVIGAKYVYPFIDPGAEAYCVFSEDIPWQREVLGLLVKSYDANSSNAPNFELTTQLGLLEIWQALLEHCFPPPETAQSYCDPQVKAMLRQLEEHYPEPFDLGEFAAGFHQSKSACCRKFKRYVHCTITQYLENCRIWEAGRMLVTTEGTVTEIAHQVGFCNTSYFIKRFRVLTGMTPVQYRREQGEI